MGDAGERSLTAVLKDIAGNVQEMVRAEIRLAKVEATEQVTTAARGAAFVAVGGVFAAIALAFVLLGGAYLLAKVVAMWAAVLIVGGAAALIGGLLIAAGIKRMKDVSLALPKTVANLKESVEWAKPSAR
jgi:uncharacterized membrane protein YqjE